MVVPQWSAEGRVAMSTITIGEDLTKNVFSVCKRDAAGSLLRRRDLQHAEFDV